MLTDRLAYTYLIGWSAHNKFYYGVRYARGCNPSDLWESYYTSSKNVHQFRKQYGDPDICSVRKTFVSTDKARTWETKVLKRLNVVANNKWLNQTDNKAISYESGLEGSRIAAAITKGKHQSKEHNEKKSRSLMGHKVSEETRRKISETRKLRKISSPMKGRTQSEESRAKISKAKLGKPGHKHTEEHKQYMSQRMKGNKNGKRNRAPL